MICLTYRDDERNAFIYTDSKSKRYYCWLRCRLNIIFDLEWVYEEFS